MNYDADLYNRATIHAGEFGWCGSGDFSKIHR